MPSVEMIPVKMSMQLSTGAMNHSNLEQNVVATC